MSLEEFRARFKAKSGCNKCYGRGYIGRDALTNNYISCKCIKEIVMPKGLVDESEPYSDY